MKGLLLLVVIYLVDRYVPGWEGTAYYAVVGLMAIGAISTLVSFCNALQFEKVGAGDPDIPFFAIALPLIMALGNAAAFYFLVPALLVWIIVFTIFQLALTYYVLVTRV